MTTHSSELVLSGPTPRLTPLDYFQQRAALQYNWIEDDGYAFVMGHDTAVFSQVNPDLNPDRIVQILVAMAKEQLRHDQVAGESGHPPRTGP